MKLHLGMTVPKVPKQSRCSIKCHKIHHKWLNNNQEDMQQVTFVWQSLLCLTYLSTFGIVITISTFILRCFCHLFAIS